MWLPQSCGAHPFGKADLGDEVGSVQCVPRGISRESTNAFAEGKGG
jgi:hypothetical protein